MGSMSLRSTVTWMLIAAVLLVAAATMDAIPVIQAYRINSSVEHIMQSAQREPAPDGISAEERFAYAWRLAQLGETELAIAEYRLLGSAANAPQRIRIAAHYNLGNIYLRDALDQAKDINVDKARSQGQLAKAHLREVLRQDPQYWAARYNLEVAHRIVPDLPLGEGGEDPKAIQREDVFSDMSGSPYGLP